MCKTCGNVIGLINGNADHLMCCGNNMEELIANSTEAAQEKHIPIYVRTDDQIIVKVGSIEHPMDDDHYIMWVALVSENETTRVRLKPNHSTEVKFKYIPNSTIYAYCNKHGLWKQEVK